MSGVTTDDAGIEIVIEQRTGKERAGDAIDKELDLGPAINQGDMVPSVGGDGDTAVIASNTEVINVEVVLAHIAIARSSGNAEEIAATDGAGSKDGQAKASIGAGIDPALDAPGAGEGIRAADLDITVGAVKLEGLADFTRGEGDVADDGSVIGADGIRGIAFGAPPTDDSGRGRIAGRQRIDSERGIGAIGAAIEICEGASFQVSGLDERLRRYTFT